MTTPKSEFFKEIQLKDRLTFIPSLRAFSIKTIQEKQESKQLLKRKDGGGGIERLTESDTLWGDEQSSQPWKPAEIEEQGDTLKIFMEPSPWELEDNDSESLERLQVLVQRFIDHRKKMLLEKMPYTEELIKKSQYSMMQAQLNYRYPGIREFVNSETLFDKIVKDYKENPNLSNLKDKVRIKRSYPNQNQLADSNHEKYKKYSSPEDLEKDEFWDAIVVTAREPGSQILTVRMVNIQWFDEEVQEFFPVVLRISSEDVDLLGPPTIEDLRKLEVYEVRTYCHAVGIETFRWGSVYPIDPEMKQIYPDYFSDESI